MWVIEIEIPPICHYGDQFIKYRFKHATSANYSKAVKLAQTVKSSLYSVNGAVPTGTWSSVIEGRRKKTDIGKTYSPTVQVKTRKVVEINGIQVNWHLYKQDERTVIHDRGLFEESQNIRGENSWLLT